MWHGCEPLWKLWPINVWCEKIGKCVCTSMVVAAHVGNSLMQLTCDCGEQTKANPFKQHAPVARPFHAFGNTVMLLIIFLVWFASKRQFLMYFFALQLWRRCDPEMGCKHLLTSVSNITWFGMIWCYCTSFYGFQNGTCWTDSWGAHSWISSMKETLPLSGWCNMLASLPELCWPKLWWFARLILSWTI